MNYQRRDFLKLAGMGSAALGASYIGMAAKSINSKNAVLTGRDKYGGCTDIHFEPTGFFRLEKADRWWLVTPEGNAFLSFGANHVDIRNIMASYNKEFWAKKFGIGENADSKAFLPGFEKKVKDDLKAFGMNTLGTHSGTGMYSESIANDVVNCRMVDICHYMTPTEDDFPDVFSDDFVKHCDQRARAIAAPRKDDPFVIGYSMTDCPILTDPESWPHDYNVYGWRTDQKPTWSQVLRNKGENSPGKRVYVSAMRQIYHNSIREFNDTYNTDFKSFDDLLQATQWRRRPQYSNSREGRDNYEFLLKVVDRCYEVEVAAIRKHDPNHIILGDKFQGNRMGLEVPDEIIALCGKHFDLIFFQKYTVWHDLEPLLNKFARFGGGKPIYMGDSSINVPNENMPDPFGPQCVNQKIRAEVFKKVFYSSYARNDFVGWDWCGWMDLWAKDPDQARAERFEKAALAAAEATGQQIRIGLRDPRHGGVQDPYGNYDQPIQKAMKEFSEKMYDIAIGKISYTQD